MTASSLVVVADRGSLRAYRVQETPTRGPHLELMQAFEVTDVMNAPTMRHRTPMTDWPQLEAEMERRACKELATEIAKIVERIMPQVEELIERYPLRGIKGPVGTGQDMLDLLGSPGRLEMKVEISLMPSAS